MKDEDKTKEQLIHELAGLRQRIAELEASETERKRVEEELRLFKAIVEASHEAIAISGPDGQLVYINPAHEKLFGRSLGEARRLNYRNYYPPESVEALNRDVAPTLARGESWEGELDVFDANGRRFPLWERADSVRDADGKMLYGFGFMHDITERKRAEEALKEGLMQIEQAKQEWESTADSLTSLVCLLDDQGRIIRANRTVENWNLGQVVEVKGWGWHELLHPCCTDPACYLETFRHRAWGELAQGRSVECEAEDRVLKRHFSIQVRPISAQTDGEGKKAASFAVAIVHDITERKRAEAERERLLTTLNRRNIQLQTAAKVSKSASTILDTEELMNQAVSLIQAQFNFYYVGIFLVDKAGEYAVLRAGTGEAGRRMLEESHKLAIGDESMIGWSVANAKARIALDVGKEAVRFDNPYLPETRSEMALPLLSRGQCLGALTVQSTEEAAFSEEDIAVLQTMADHLAIAIENAWFYDAAQREIVERKRAEEQIHISLKEKEVLLKEIHHRVKNNLQVVSSLLKLQSDYIEDEQSLKTFRESQNRVKSMALVHERLYQSRDLARIDFAKYIRTLAIYLFRSYGVNPSVITLKIDMDNVLLGVDTAIPCGLITNELVSNALKHAFPAGRTGEICINLHADDKLTLIVSDNGVGFPKGLDFRNTESLGLHLVLTLAKQLEGTIELDRSGGTAFKITFPRPKH